MPLATEPTTRQSKTCGSFCFLRLIRWTQERVEVGANVFGHAYCNKKVIKNLVIKCNVIHTFCKCRWTAWISLAGRSLPSPGLAGFMVHRPVSLVSNNIAIGASGLGFVVWASQSEHSVATAAMFLRIRSCVAQSPYRKTGCIRTAGWIRTSTE